MRCASVGDLAADTMFLVGWTRFVREVRDTVAVNVEVLAMFLVAVSDLVGIPMFPVRGYYDDPEEYLTCSNTFRIFPSATLLGLYRN